MRSKRPGCTTIWLLTSNEKDPETKQHVSAFDNSLLFKRLRPIGDLEVLRTIDYINPCAALVRSGSGGRSLSKAQRSKQWFTGCAFWDGLRSSVLGQLGLQSSDGMVWVDLLPYDDKLTQSVVQARAQQGPKIPTQMLISTIWAKMGFHGPDSGEKVDNGRVEQFLKSSARAYVAARVRGRQLKFDDFDISNANGADHRGLLPTLDPKAFTLTCPNAHGFLPLRQDTLDLLGQKIQTDSLKKELEAAIQKHDGLFNPSGFPFKGEAKRSSPEVDDGMAAEVANAKTYSPDAGGPKSKDEFDNDATFPGQQADHEFGFKGGVLYAHALEDCVVSSKLPVLRLWGEYYCGTEKKKDIVKFKANHFMWEMTSLDYEASFCIQKKGQDPEPYKKCSPTTLSDFVAHLEDQGKINFRIECHNLKEVTKEAEGQRVVSYEVEASEECLFLAKALPAKTKAVKANAGSLMTFASRDFKNLEHTAGRVRMVPGLAYDDEHNSIIPVKPVIFLTHPIKMKKGEVVRLG